MKGKLSLGFHLAVLIVVSIVTYFVFSSIEEKPIKAATILDLSRLDLERLVFSKEAKIVEIERRNESGLTLRIAEQTKKPVKKDGADHNQKEGSDSLPDVDFEGTIEDEDEEFQEIEPLAITETKQESYRANEKFEKKLDGLLPLIAKRNLNDVGHEELAKFGLVDGERTLTFETNDQKVTFEVGAKTYGGATTYLRQMPNGPVYLVTTGLIRLVDISPTKYIERRLVGFDEEELEEIVINNGQNASQNLLKQGKGKNAKWAAAERPDDPSDIYDNWVNTLLRMDTNEYLSEDDLPKLNHVAKFEFRKQGELLDILEFASSDASDTDGGKKDYFGRSGHTGQWVKIHRINAETLATDLPTILQH
ncbi:MAG: DUF4340 domain-containing protein [Proteobacteria bacterium]|nr:DUF4340 domain-containing protein [Pseudomonadota bacterium]